MFKKIIYVPIALAISIVIAQCVYKKAPVQKAAASAGLITHKEAIDSLRADTTTAEIKPLIIKALDAQQIAAVFQNNRLDSLFINSYPDNGFYGDDRYRIEFIFSEATRDEKDPSVYHIKGKNRHKKEITNFEGTIKFDNAKHFYDPNIDSTSWNEMGYKNCYSLDGTFELKEDTTSDYGGLFKGKVKMEFVEMKEGLPSLWFFSPGGFAMEGSGTAGYRFDGTWTYYKKPDMVKPVIWARDLFSFANDILKDFSMGERDVEINENYRHLGWDEFWENEEWWNTAEKPKM